MFTASPFHPSLTSHGVLVVDDSAIQREAVSAQLRLLGLTRLLTAADGHAALELVRAQTTLPAAVCVDLEMPGMDGIEFLQQITQIGWRPAVLVVSGANPAVLNSVELMVNALGLPLLGVTPKPLTTARLRQLLLKLDEPAPTSPTAPSQAPAPMTALELEAALSSGRLLPHYQPKVALKTGEIVGLEALARCTNREGRLLPPSVFIEPAERHGLMNALTMTMLEQVLRDLTQWHADDFYPTVSLNVSASSLADRRFGDEIMRRVDAARISPSALTLEITETALVSDLAAAIGMLGRMRLKGFGLALDDYGTGFSSLQQLDRLPFSELKIDRSFVHNVDQKKSRATILGAAINTGQQLHLTTVAEGVETVGELAKLKALGCNQVQGFLIAKPMPGALVLPWLHEQRDRIRLLCHAE